MDLFVLRRIQAEAHSKWLNDHHQEEQEETMTPHAEIQDGSNNHEEILVLGPPPLSRWESDGGRTDKPVILAPSVQKRCKACCSRKGCSTRRPKEGRRKCAGDIPAFVTLPF